MSVGLLFRLAAIAAIVGGVLRAIDSFAFEFLDSGDSAMLFLVTDIALLFASMGLFAYLNRAIGWLGLGGFVVAIVGFVLVRSAGDNIDAYIGGATTVAAGMAIFGIAIMLFCVFSVVGPTLWLVALIAGVAAFFTESDWLFEFAGVAFGIGYTVAGIALLRAQTASPATGTSLP